MNKAFSKERGRGMAQEMKIFARPIKIKNDLYILHAYYSAVTCNVLFNGPQPKIVKYDAHNASGKWSLAQLCANRKAASISTHRVSPFRE